MIYDITTKRSEEQLRLLPEPLFYLLDRPRTGPLAHHGRRHDLALTYDPLSRASIGDRRPEEADGRLVEVYVLIIGQVSVGIDERGPGPGL